MIDRMTKRSSRDLYKAKSTPIDVQCFGQLPVHVYIGHNMTVISFKSPCTRDQDGGQGLFKSLSSDTAGLFLNSIMPVIKYNYRFLRVLLGQNFRLCFIPPYFIVLGPYTFLIWVYFCDNNLF